MDQCEQVSPFNVVFEQYESYIVARQLRKKEVVLFKIKPLFLNF